MGRTNYSVLERNVLDSLETEDGKAAFLWACSSDKSRQKHLAEEYAREVDGLSKGLDTLLGHASHGHEAPAEVVDDLKAFILTRHKNWRHPKGGAINGN